MGNRASMTIRVVQKEEAAQLLVQAEDIDHYQVECYEDRCNSYARRNFAYAPNTVSSMPYYNQFFSQMSSYVPKQLRDIGDIRIVLLMPSADGGMPHTRPPNLICYPGELSTSVTIFVHELCHVHQRKFPHVWRYIFAALGWKVWNGQLPPSLDGCRRYNPDTVDRPLWIHGDWVPIPVFQDVYKPVLTDVDIWFYHIKQDYHVKKVPDDIMIAGLPHSAYEHPREITAYIISEPERYKGTMAYEIIKQYVDI
jgi:hypothetical protein